MKKIILLAIIILASIAPIHAQKANSIPIDAAHFPDEIFRDYIRAQFDLNHDGMLNKKERLQVIYIDIYGFLISNLGGISYFPNLEGLSCNNNPITSLDVLKDCHNLKGLYFGLNHHLTSVDLSECVNLQTLTFQYCYGLQAIDLSGCVNLQTLTFYDNSSLQSLDLSGCVNLQTLHCQRNRRLQTLNLSGCASSTYVTIENNPNFTTLNVNGCTKLSQLLCRNNHLEFISLQDCPSLRTIWCDSNQLSSLDLSTCDQQYLSITYSNNKRYILQNENRTFDLNQLPNFDMTKADNWDGGFLTESTLTFIKDTVSYDYDLSHSSGVKARFMLVSTTEIPNPSDDFDEDDDIDNTDDPVDPDNPDDPDDPDAPDDPDDPDDPTDPTDPDDPDNPTDPDDPDDPDEPTDPDTPDKPNYPLTANEPTDAPANLFSVHPVPFRNTLHIKTELKLQSVCLYNMQGRLCARFEHGFDALPTAKLKPGLYLLLLETADGATYRLKAIKE